MKINTNSVRGTRDILPKEAQLREWVRLTILNTYNQFGFSNIQTPILEDINLLDNSNGGDNTKLIFKVLKRGANLDLQNITKENDLCDMGLRYDLTVPLARFYCANNNELPSPFKSIQIADVFRAERPQRGRIRQFTQCDIDILGDDSAKAEIEVVLVSAKAMCNLGFKNFKFAISSRVIINQILKNIGYADEEISEVSVVLDKLDKIGADGIKQELNEKGLAKYADKLIEAFADIQKNGINQCVHYGASEVECERLIKVISTINDCSKGLFTAEFDATIIRGQGYYTGFVCELYCDGFDGACGGGGRYDNMIEKLIGVRTPAVGFSIGFERICLILSEQNISQPKIKESIALIYMPEDDYSCIFNYAEELSLNYNVNMVKKNNNFKNQLLKLQNLGYTKYVFLDSKVIKEI